MWVNCKASGGHGLGNNGLELTTAMQRFRSIRVEHWVHGAWHEAVTGTMRTRFKVNKTDVNLFRPDLGGIALGMSVPKISKSEAAKRQLDTAIDLFFEAGDALSVHTLAFAAFKVLLNLYPHRKNDDFGEQIDKLISEGIGWQRFNNTANFLKHADRDPDGFLEDFDAEMVLPLIGLATLLYRRLSGDFSPKMEAFDFWVETMAANELGIEDGDENKDRLRMEGEIREQIKDAPIDVRMKFASASYHYFLENRERIEAVVEQYRSEGKTLTQALDEHMTERQNGQQ